ncbi:uncharacterized protein MAM_04344 [Metarhizium album ARSEF 1941]|uniref:Uncharacterized protein n=1 Tax=Metarhizium album (strain ARSEF 1941) TaxID=1081103 RepID=A0A0B2WYM8_METAS|nr:uncharacterized protein MAM_04344 [Metarhizium album ARSEF 1941]KHN97955.1 hypothetical protein MAM_04344 [Metarhizium album ARSEF 1941]
MLPGMMNPCLALADAQAEPRATVASVPALLQVLLGLRHLGAVLFCDVVVDEEQSRASVGDAADLRGLELVVADGVPGNMAVNVAQVVGPI